MIKETTTFTTLTKVDDKISVSNCPNKNGRSIIKCNVVI